MQSNNTFPQHNQTPVTCPTETQLTWRACSRPLRSFSCRHPWKVELVNTVLLRLRAIMSHSLNWNGLCESLESVLPNYHGNSALAHCLLTTNIVESSVDLLVELIEVWPRDLTCPSATHSERSWLFALSCSDSSRNLCVSCCVSSTESRAMGISGIATRKLLCLLCFRRRLSSYWHFWHCDLRAMSLLLCVRCKLASKSCDWIWLRILKQTATFLVRSAELLLTPLFQSISSTNGPSPFLHFVSP